jgi:hypothetical protein
MTKQENKDFSFTPMIDIPLGFWEFKLKELDYNYWVNQVYEYIKYNPKSENISNEGGYQSQTNIQNEYTFFPLVNLLLEKIKLLNGNSNIKIFEMWINISKTGDFNHPHSHGYPNDHFQSGVLYLKTPLNCGNIVFLNPLDTNKSKHIEPKEKDLVIFPNIMSHYVTPNQSKEERISISFNYG